MQVRKAKTEDIARIMEIYRYAKQYMRESGNPTQWTDGYPQKEIIENDIRTGQCYVCEEEEELCGVFMLALGEEPTYRVIKDGTWKNEEPYGTIHRLASDGSRKGIFAVCLAFCRNKRKNLRADTHADNKTMQYLLEKNGFKRCGIIYVGDGTPRIAYQLAE